MRNRSRDPVRGLREGAVDIAVAHGPMRDQIVGTFRARLRRIALEPRAWIDHRRQRLVVERHQARRILGQRAALRDHQRDRLTHIVSSRSREVAGIDMKPDRRDRQRQRDAVARQQRTQVGIGQDRAHARQAAGTSGVDAVEFRMRDRAANEDGMLQARKLDIVDEAAAAAQQARIFQALDGAAHPGAGRITHCRSSLPVMLW